MINNNCTFAGADNERSANSKGIYIFFGSTPIKKFNFFVFTSRNFGSFDFDFGGGPGIRASVRRPSPPVTRQPPDFATVIRRRRFATLRLIQVPGPHFISTAI